MAAKRYMWEAATARRRKLTEPVAVGVNQDGLLHSLVQHGSWTRGCGWTWTTDGATAKMLNRLVDRGLVVKSPQWTGKYGHSKDVYRCIARPVA